MRVEFYKGLIKKDQFLFSKNLDLIPREGEIIFIKDDLGYAILSIIWDLREKGNPVVLISLRELCQVNIYDD